MTPSSLIRHRRRMLTRAWVRYCENPGEWASWLLERARKLAEVDERTIWRDLRVMPSARRKQGTWPRPDSVEEGSGVDS